AAATDRADDLPQRVDGPTTPADHGPEVVGVDPDLEPFPATGVDQTDPDVVGVVDDALHKVFKRWPQHGYSPLFSEAWASVPASAGASAVSSALTSSVLADSSFFPEDFLAFEADFFAVFFASASSAALAGSMPASFSAPEYSSDLSAFSSAVCSGAGAGRP